MKQPCMPSNFATVCYLVVLDCVHQSTDDTLSQAHAKGRAPNLREASLSARLRVAKIYFFVWCTNALSDSQLMSHGSFSATHCSCALEPAATGPCENLARTTTCKSSDQFLRKFVNCCSIAYSFPPCRRFACSPGSLLGVSCPSLAAARIPEAFFRASNPAETSRMPIVAQCTFALNSNNSRRRSLR